MDLSLLVLLPLVTAIAILFGKGLKQVRAIALVGAVLQLLLVVVLFVLYQQERAAGNTATMLFESEREWFPTVGIGLHVGVDNCDGREQNYDPGIF